MSLDVHITGWHVVPAVYALLLLGIGLAWRRWSRPPVVPPECGQPVGAYTCEARPVAGCGNAMCAKCCAKLCGPECPRVMSRLGTMCTRCGQVACKDDETRAAAATIENLKDTELP